MAEILIKSILYELILNLPFDREIQIQMLDVPPECFPKPIRDLVQMYQNMNPAVEDEVREEMKAAVIALLMEGGKQ